MAERREFGHLYRRPGSSYWWVRYRVNGRTYRESTRSTSERRAAELLMQRRIELGRGDFVAPDANRTSFDDLESLLLANYKNAGRDTTRVEISLNQLRGFFGQHRARMITYDAVEPYKCKRIDNEAARSTINSELSALSKAFKLALRARKVREIPPIDRFGQLHNARTGFFEEREFREVLAKLPEHWRPPIEFGYYTGWRVRSEVLTLTWAQVDLEAKIVRLDPGTTKNREGRVFPFTTYPQLDELLACQRAATRTLEKDRGSIIPWVFHRRGQRLTDYKHAWTKACVAAGHPGMLVHDLRRTAVRNLERACVPRSVATKLTGHKTEAVYRRYAITNEQDLAEGIAKLAKLHGAAPNQGTLRAQSAERAG